VIKSILMFVLGFLAALTAVIATAWFGRTKVVNLISESYGYKKAGQVVVLLQDFRLQQNGVEVGYLSKNTQLTFDGYAKDSPMEYYSVSLGWENRGAEREKLFKESPEKERAFLKLVGGK
jgi:hypothetical protein